VKIPLADQIAEAEHHRDALQIAIAARPELAERLNRAEGMVLTLRLIQATEGPFREFMKTRTRNAA